MQLNRIIPTFILMLGLSGFVAGQSSQDAPVLKTRPNTSQSQPAANEPAASQDQQQNYPQQQYAPPEFRQGRQASEDAVPQGTRFLVTLLEPLDTKTLEKGQHFRAELRDNLITSSGMVIPRGCEVHAHVATFERGYMGARMMLAFDEMKTSSGWVPLIAMVTGVPGDPSIKSTSNEGELMQKGPDKARLIASAAIGAAIGAASGASAGGAKGAAAGAAAGAGLGTTTSFLMQGSDMKLDPGTNLELRLDRDMVVPTR